MVRCWYGRRNGKMRFARAMRRRNVTAARNEGSELEVAASLHFLLLLSVTDACRWFD